MHNADCIKVLRWAAENEYGHRPFLILGGERLIFGALELASRAPLPYGEQLYQIIGRKRTIVYFQWVLQRASKGLLAGDYKQLFFEESGRPFPDNAYEQLELAVRAVLDSWMSSRAKEYREIHNIKGIRGTAVTVQAMVFGNMSMDSGAGIAFTRNPWTGDKIPVVDFRSGAQGEDAVSGSRAVTSGIELKTALPAVYRKIEEIGEKLEAHFRDMQDIEFTVEEGKLYILQSRSGKRSPLAALAKGDSASTGVAVGKIAFSSERTKSYASEGGGGDEDR